MLGWAVVVCCLRVWCGAAAAVATIFARLGSVFLGVLVTCIILYGGVMYECFVVRNRRLRGGVERGVWDLSTCCSHGYF